MGRLKLKPRKRPFNPSDISEEVETTVVVSGAECIIAYSKPVNLVKLDRAGLAAFIAGLQGKLKQMPGGEPQRERFLIARRHADATMWLRKNRGGKAPTILLTSGRNDVMKLYGVDLKAGDVAETEYAKTGEHYQEIMGEVRERLSRNEPKSSG